MLNHGISFKTYLKSHCDVLPIANMIAKSVNKSSTVATNWNAFNKRKYTNYGHS